MQLSVEQILEILRLVDASQCEEFRLETADLKLIVRKGSAGPGVEAGPESDPARAVPVTDTADSGVGWSAAGVVPGASASRSAPAEVVPEGLVAIRSPMVGTFYRAPAPGASPFVEEGSHVKENDIVCILEVMKLMNSLQAGVRGRVARVCAENATLVSQGQVLLLIEPEEAEDGSTGS